MSQVDQQESQGGSSFFANAAFDTEVFPGGPRGFKLFSISNRLTDAAMAVLYQLVAGQEATGKSKAELLKWLEEQDVLSDVFCEAVDQAEAKARQVPFSPVPEVSAAAVRKQERMQRRKAITGRCVVPRAPLRESVGVRVQVGESTRGAIYELQDDLELDDGHLTVVTPQQGGDMSIAEVAAALDLDAGELLTINQKLYPRLKSASEKLRKGTTVWLEDSDDEEEEAELDPGADDDGAVPAEASSRIVAPMRVSKRARDFAVDYRPDSEKAVKAARAARALAEADPAAVAAMDPLVRSRLGLDVHDVRAAAAAAAAAAHVPALPIAQIAMPAPAGPPGVLHGAPPPPPPPPPGVKHTHGLAPIEFLFPSNQSAETQLRIMQRDKPVPIFRTPEAMFGKINEAVLDHPGISDSEKVRINKENLQRAFAMRSAATAVGLDHDQLATVVKRSTIDQITGQTDDPYVKQFEKRLTAEFDKKVKAEEKAKKKAAEAATAPAAPNLIEPLVSAVTMLGQSLQGFGKGGRGGKGDKGGGGKGAEHRSCYVCNESGHIARDCSRRGAGR
jgi:hypothetical protein